MEIYYIFISIYCLPNIIIIFLSKYLRICGTTLSVDSMQHVSDAATDDDGRGLHLFRGGDYKRRIVKNRSDRSGFLWDHEECAAGSWPNLYETKKINVVRHKLKIARYLLLLYLYKHPFFIEEIKFPEISLQIS